MASHSEPRILSFRASAAIVKGRAVKIDSDRETIVECSANGDGAIGVAQNALSTADAAAGVHCEVALQGGGGKGLAGETITAGKLLVPASDGDLEQTNASGDRVIAMAMEDAVAGDLFAIEISHAVASAADE